MHPHLLHCLAAGWSLHTALDHLARRAADEQRAIDQDLTNAADGLRSPTYGTRTSVGGHGDPTGLLVLAGTRPRVNRWQQLAESIDDTLRWLTVKLDCAAADRWPLYCLRDATPHLRPGQAQNLTLWLSDCDQRIRRPLALPPDRWALPGAPECPACRQRLLYVQTSGPGEVWTVICGAGCVCVGDGCHCRMPVRVEGVGHIWDRTHPLVIAALAATGDMA